MAEERLIDEDKEKNKDKKYRIRVGEDGEEELIVSEQEEGPTEEVSFEVPEPTEDDEEAAVMTPEQLAAKRAQQERERLELENKVRGLLDKAEADLGAARYATALEFLEQAEELAPENGDLHALRLSVYTCGFTDYSQITKAAESAESVKKFTSAEKKSEMLAKAATGIEENIVALRSKVAALDKENEAKKAERAVRFNADRNKAAIVFSCLLVCLAAAVAFCGYYASIIYSVSDGTYLIVTCVLAGVALLFLIAEIFAARALNVACRRVRLNKRNTTTKLGRELLAEQAKLKAFIQIRDALSEQ